MWVRRGPLEGIRVHVERRPGLGGEADLQIDLFKDKWEQVMDKMLSEARRTMAVCTKRMVICIAAADHWELGRQDAEYFCKNCQSWSCCAITSRAMSELFTTISGEQKKRVVRVPYNQIGSTQVISVLLL